MKAGDLRWLYFRLKAMPPGEIAHRAIEFGKRRWDQTTQYDFRASATTPPRVPGFRERVLNAAPQARQYFRDAAMAVAEGKYHFLGQQWPHQGETPDWHLDPVSKVRWPGDVFCFSVPFRHNREYGDVKYVWEINRLQHLQCVAAAAACDDDARLAKLCVLQLRSWIAANPPFMGVNWASGIELALRVVSLTVIFSLLPPSCFSADDLRAIDATLRAHLHWLARYPSGFSSANNHLVAEAAALFILGLLTKLPGASDALAYGRRILDREALLQFLPDGAPAEQSPTYGAFTAEWMLLADFIAREAGYPGLAPDSLARLDKFGDFLASMTDCRGNVPRIGDDDEGRAIAGGGSSNNYLASIAAALAGRRGLGSAGHDESGEPLRRIFLNLPPSAPPAKAPDSVQTFPDGGYSVVRESVRGVESLLLFDHGPLGYLSIAAHGHADALAIWLHIGGQPVLIDGGTYLYHSGAQWREHFRGTAAHSTLLVADADQSIQAGDFNWSARAVTRMLSSRVDGCSVRLAAEHNGYLDRFGVRHRRAVERKATGTCIIEDLLVGEARNFPKAEVGFLVSPELTVESTDVGWIIGNQTRSLVTLACPEAAGRSVQRGLFSPQLRGWTSSAFGLKEPATRLVAEVSRETHSLKSVLTVL